MSQLTRGTTPTIIFTFNTVQVSVIQAAYLSIKQGKTYIEYDLSDAIIDTDANTLSWKLTQQDTLRIASYGKVEVQCRYKLNDDSAGASTVYELDGYRILKDGEI